MFITYEKHEISSANLNSLNVTEDTVI